ncbi:uncharacterized protein LOC131155335 [Malania oleifera]|uniref:uncharacterized protein LOC131155335 n=1 Tax=Malania oleifera TaxID=397392 RepID=UPI0025AE2DD0|nr:uncharacterized protein LOC131155335 [Malania oleifera]
MRTPPIRSSRLRSSCFCREEMDRTKAFAVAFICFVVIGVGGRSPPPPRPPPSPPPKNPYPAKHHYHHGKHVTRSVASPPQPVPALPAGVPAPVLWKQPIMLGFCTAEGMGHLNVWNSHPKNCSPGSRACRVCGNPHGLIKKYGLMSCRQRFHSNAKEIYFIKYRQGSIFGRDALVRPSWRLNELRL